MEIEKKNQKETLLTQVWTIQTTVSGAEDAERIARRLLELRLVACVQIDGPIQSLYRWEGAIQKEVEWRLTIKTETSMVARCEAVLTSEHPYQIPEILAVAADHAAPGYFDWLRQQIAPSNFHIRLLLNDLANRISFEHLIEQLSLRPRLHAEPDGSFVWRSTSEASFAEPWQLDGMIYDRNGQIEYLELKGSCDREAWIELCSVCNLADLNTIRVQVVGSDQGYSALEFADQLSPR